MSGVVTEAQYQALLDAHNKTTHHHNSLFHAHNQTADYISQMGQRLANVQNRVEAESNRFDAVVHIQDAHTEELRNVLQRVNRLANRLEAAEEARAAAERAREAAEQARQEDKQAFETRIKALEDNSTAAQAQYSEIEKLKERVTTLESKEPIYAKRLLSAEDTIAAIQRENLQLKGRVTSLTEFLEQVAVNAGAAHELSASADKKLDRNEEKLDRTERKVDRLLALLETAVPTSPNSTPLSSTPPSPSRTEASPQLSLLSIQPYPDLLSRIRAFKVLQESQARLESQAREGMPAIPVAALVQLPSNGQPQTDS